MGKKTVAVIGGGSGLGRYIVIEELNKNNNVLVFTSKIQDEIFDKNVSYCEMDFLKFNIKLVDKHLKKNEISKIYFCSVIASYKDFKDLKRTDIESQIRFNVTNVLLFIHLLINKYHKVKLVYILSHVCFIFSPGFALYRMNKKAIEDILFSLEIENPRFTVSKVYPGAMDTNFVRNTNYKGFSIFKRRDPNWWAKKIVNSQKNTVVSKVDYLIQILDYIVPFRLKKLIYRKFMSI